MARGFKGGFKDTDLDYLVLQLLQEVMAKSKLDPNLIDDVVMGNVRVIVSIEGLHPRRRRREAQYFY